MTTNKKSKGAVYTGVLAALAASSCCIPPVIAMIAGVGGIASSLSWMEPFRPYLILLAVIAIGYAWYNYYKTKQKDDCGCNIEKPKFYQTKRFLIIITLFSVITIGFPYYSHVFYPNNSNNISISEANKKVVNFKIEGMTCASCEEHITFAVQELEGVVSVGASYKNKSAEVTFDKTKTDISKIEKAINASGYNVIGVK